VPVRDVIAHRENLFGVFVEQKMIIAKMSAGHVAVEILGLHVKTEDVRQQTS
jgi:hypothetical protein